MPSVSLPALHSAPPTPFPGHPVLTPCLATPCLVLVQFHLAMLQHPAAAVVLDSNASLFASQFAYNSQWWERPACFDDYFSPTSSEPPGQVLEGTGVREPAARDPPFALHFNGPAGRHRLGWCIAATLKAASREGQHYLDLDNSGMAVKLPTYCDGGPPIQGAARRGAAPPVGRRAVTLPPCSKHTEEQVPQATRPTQLNCINDRCWSMAS